MSDDSIDKADCYKTIIHRPVLNPTKAMKNKFNNSF